MKKPTKSIIASALLAVSFGALSVGSTFALFTSQSETAIEVESGKIQVSSAISDFVTYSAEVNANGDRADENGNKYISKQTAVNGVFTNGGEAGYVNSCFTLERITPGDRVTFSIDIGDDSNVDFQYRLVYKVVSQDTSLAKALRTTTDVDGQATTYDGLLELTTCWKPAHPSDLDDLAFSFDIELPIDKGNQYQEKEVEFAFTLQAVQGNAYTDNNGAKVLTGIEDMSENSVAQADQALVIEVADAEGEDKEFGVTATIPANLIEAGNKVELLVSDAEMDVNTAAAATLDFDITLKVNDETVSSFEQPITVEVYVGKNLNISQVLHNGDPVTNYSYNENTGIITFTTSSFSPFVVKYQMSPSGSGAGIIDDGDEF